MRIGREGWILGVLLLIFVASTAFFSGHDIQEEKAKQPGLKLSADKKSVQVVREVDGGVETPCDKLVAAERSRQRRHV